MYVLLISCHVLLYIKISYNALYYIIQETRVHLVIATSATQKLSKVSLDILDEFDAPSFCTTKSIIAYPVITLYAQH